MQLGNLSRQVPINFQLGEAMGYPLMTNIALYCNLVLEATALGLLFTMPQSQRAGDVFPTEQALNMYSLAVVGLMISCLTAIVATFFTRRSGAAAITALMGCAGFHLTWVLFIVGRIMSLSDESALQALVPHGLLCVVSLAGVVSALVYETERSKKKSKLS